MEHKHYVGFFMMNVNYQKLGIGSAIIQDVLDWLEEEWFHPDQGNNRD